MNQHVAERFDPTEEYQWYGGTVSHSRGYNLDFLYFFVGDGTLATQEKFSDEYLSVVRQFVGKEVKYTNKNILAQKNAWYFHDIGGEDFIKCSSKCFLAQFLLSKGFYDHNVEVVTGSEPLQANKISDQTRYYIKQDNNFAGRGNKILLGHEVKSFKFDTPHVIEEYLDRVLDFAITFMSDQEIIIYQNKVNSHGQYQGTIIDRSLVTNIESFLQSNGVCSKEMRIFMNRFNEIISMYKDSFFGSRLFRGSFDFFLYNHEGIIKVHPGCEFNPRWTMGRVAWTIFSRYVPIGHDQANFIFSAKPVEGSVLLSPKTSKINYTMTLN
jgi:hypothetical protein